MTSPAILFPQRFNEEPLPPSKESYHEHPPLRHQVTTATAASVLAIMLSPLTPARAESHEPIRKYFSSESIQKARSASAHGPLSTKQRQAKDAHMARAATDGLILLDDDVDVIQLDDETTVVTNKSARISSIDIAGTAENLSAEIHAEDPGVLAPTQGVGQAYWATGTSGTTTIIIQGKGRMQSTWRKRQLINDGDASYDYYSYERTGWGQGDAISGLDWSVTGMMLRSYPTSGTAANFKGIIARKPGASFTGDCNSLPLSLELSYKAVAVGTQFQDCNSYKVTFGSQFGDYSIFFSQGALFSQGNRQVGYNEIIKARQGSLTAWNDYSRLELARTVYPAVKCDVTNGNRTC